MEAKDLRINNKVADKDGVIGYIRADGILEFFNGELEFSPVAITEERIFSLGFVEKDNENEDNSISYYELNGFILGMDFQPINIELDYKLEYIHQLQNLYFSTKGVEII